MHCSILQCQRLHCVQCTSHCYGINTRQFERPQGSQYPTLRMWFKSMPEGAVFSFLIYHFDIKQSAFAMLCDAMLLGAVKRDNATVDALYLTFERQNRSPLERVHAIRLTQNLISAHDGRC